MLPVIRVDMGDLTQDFVVGQGLEYGMRGMGKTIMRGAKSLVNGMSIQKNAALDRVINDIGSLNSAKFDLLLRTYALRARLNVLLMHVKEVLLLFSREDLSLALFPFQDKINVKMSYDETQVHSINAHLTDIYNAIKGLQSTKEISEFVSMLTTKYNDLARVATDGTPVGSVGIPADGAQMAYAFPTTHYYPVLLRLP